MNKFDRFLRHRQSLLLQYKMGDLTKNEFIEENFHYIERLGIQPFTRVDNIKKAIYNYHYHNVNAKYWQSIAKDPATPARSVRPIILSPITTTGKGQINPTPAQADRLQRCGGLLRQCEIIPFKGQAHRNCYS